jgi:antitoxin (DNA-binding transcriptional repressor) of toxin-antitoxin stability system
MSVPAPTSLFPVEISALQARKQLGELLNRAYYGGERFIITRDQLPMVKIEPVYSTLEAEAAREQFFAMADEMRANAAQSGLSDAELSALIDEAVAEVQSESPVRKAAPSAL